MRQHNWVPDPFHSSASPEQSCGFRSDTLNAGHRSDGWDAMLIERIGRRSSLCHSQNSRAHIRCTQHHPYMCTHTRTQIQLHIHRHTHTHFVLTHTHKRVHTYRSYNTLQYNTIEHIRCTVFVALYCVLYCVLYCTVFVVVVAVGVVAVGCCCCCCLLFLCCCR